MKDSQRVWLGLPVFLMITAVNIILLSYGSFGIVGFFGIMIVGLIILFIPFMTVKGDWVIVDSEGIHIDAPMIKLDLPLSKITGVDCIRGFKPGYKLFGYGGLKRGSGDYNNELLGDYRFAGNTAIPIMIIVTYSDGKERYLAFNSKDEETTRAIYMTLQECVSGNGTGILSIERQKAARKSNQSTKRAFTIIMGVILASVALIVAVSMTSGHVDVTMDDDSLEIDASMMKEDIQYSDIQYVELREDMNYGSRIAGLGSMKVLSGNFSNDEFGKYRLAVYRDNPLSIVIHTTDMTCVFNLESKTETMDIFNKLNDMTLIESKDNRLTSQFTVIPCPSSLI